MVRKTFTTLGRDSGSARGIHDDNGWCKCMTGDEIVA